MVSSTHWWQHSQPQLACLVGDFEVSICEQVEKLLEAEAESVDEEGPEALSARCRQLERIAGEVSRLKFFAARGQVLPHPLIPAPCH